MDITWNSRRLGKIQLTTNGMFKNIPQTVEKVVLPQAKNKSLGVGDFDKP